ncbi:MAG TPA: glutathione S-transferase family protein [Candidatus Eisenbacteria bacterium]|nr:glutathione S-transferase family protein [Candidatus Eisenbacteria bacterium]
MITLYHSAQSRSVRPRWMLEEIGVPYDLRRVNLEAGEQKTPEFLKINPNGAVPALVDGEVKLFESGAISQYLADRFPEKRLAPPVGTPARGYYYQWIHFGLCTIEPPLLTIFLHTVAKPESERIPQLLEPARQQLRAALAVLDRALAGHTFLVGDDLTTGDVMVASTLAWAQMLGLLDASFPATAAYLGRLMGRSAFRRAMAD